MGLCVMITGTMKMPQSSAYNLAFLIMVSYHPNVEFFCKHLLHYLKPFIYRSHAVT